MDIKTVAENLHRTITGKELLYSEYKKECSTHHLDILEYLETNLTELRTILADVEACIPPDDKS